MSASVDVSLGRQGRLEARFAQVPVERALVDELIAERHAGVALHRDACGTLDANGWRESWPVVAAADCR